MEPLNIYNYSSVRQYLLDYLSARQRKDLKLSVRSWAKEMGIGSHALLIMLLQGKRAIRLKHAPYLAKGLALNTAENLYLQALIQYESADSPEEKQLCALWLADINPGKKFVTRELDEFIAISHWTYTAILMMPDLDGFRGSGEEIAKRLKGKLTPTEARAALERLLSLGLLGRDDQGRLEATFNRLTTKDDIANEGAKKYHRSATEAALDAISLPLDRREFQSFSLPVRKDKIPLAKEMIRKFRSQFAKAVGADGDGDDVYQMNVQFFQLTESPASKAEDEGVDTAQLKSKKGKEK